MSIGEWADAARRAKYYQDAEHQRAIDTLQHLLEGQMDSDSAAGTVASIYEPLLKRDPRPSPVATLWGILCDAARAFRWRQGHRRASGWSAQLDRAAARCPGPARQGRHPRMEQCGCVLEGSARARHDIQGVCDW